MEILGIPQLRSPIMILAFSGWNDAGEAASAALEHLASIWPVQTIGEFDNAEISADKALSLDPNLPIAQFIKLRAEIRKAPAQA